MKKKQRIHDIPYMTTDGEDTLSAIKRRILAAASMPELIIQLGECTSTFGFIHFTLMDVPSKHSTRVQPLIHFSSLPQPYIAAYDQAELLKASKFIRRWSEGVSPVAWDSHANFDPTDPAQVFGLRLRAINVRMGAVFLAAPVAARQQLALMVYGSRAPLSAHENADIQSLADAAFIRFHQLRPAPQTGFKSLSSREVEVIRWTAEGKTSHEIGRILSLSDHTINAYLANAIRKLECVNRAQLVAKAIRLQLID